MVLMLWPAARVSSSARRSIVASDICLLTLLFAVIVDGNDAGGQPDRDSHPANPNALALEQRAGYLIQMPLPITGSVDLEVTSKIDRLLDDLPSDGARPVLVLEFDTNNSQTGKGSQFERCLSVARYLSSGRLRDVRTVAYLPGSVEGHAVLPVLACEEIIMSAEARLGPAGIDEALIDDTIRNDYRDIANRRRVVPAAFAVGLLDQDIAVYKVKSDGVRYVLADELQKLQSEGKASDVETVKHAGELPSFTGSELRHKYPFVSHLVANRKELTNALKLPPGTLEGDPSLGSAWRSVRVELRGPIDRKVINWILQSLDHQRRNAPPNFVCVWIDSPGGSPQDSVRLAHYLAELDADQVRTVAFVPHEARADAALVALACDHLVMGTNAILGGPGEYHLRRSELTDMRETVKALAKTLGRDWSLMLAMVDPKLSVYRYSRAGTGQVRYFCDEERDQQTDQQRWTRGDEIRTEDGLRGSQAHALELVRHLTADFEELKQIYHLGDDPQMLQPAWSQIWVEQLAEFLATPWVAGMLLFAAWFFLSAELSQPGLSAPGFVSALCFLLFFWSQVLHGTAHWLEILLFVVGVLFVLLEIFIIPGIGAFGIGGAIMILISIVLASQSFVIPRNSYQLAQMPASLSMVLAAIFGVITAFVLMKRFLPDTPFFNRMLLEPPRDEEVDRRAEREALVHWEHLTGKRGVTTTQLTPSGKACFGDDVVDVISKGDLIPRGTEVIVIEVRGSRVVVAPAHCL